MSCAPWCAALYALCRVESCILSNFQRSLDLSVQHPGGVLSCLCSVHWQGAIQYAAFSATCCASWVASSVLIKTQLTIRHSFERRSFSPAFPVLPSACPYVERPVRRYLPHTASSEASCILSNIKCQVAKIRRSKTVRRPVHSPLGIQ